MYLSPETKFSKATTIKKWVVKLFICFYRPPCATHCAEHDAIYKWEQWWMGQFGLMWRRSWEVGSEEVGGGSTFKQTLHSNSCDSFMSFSWPVARSHILVILIGLSNTQIFDHDLVKSSYDFRLLLSPHGHNKQSLDYLGLATATLLLMKFWWYQDFLRNSWHVSSYQSFILAQVT